MHTCARTEDGNSKIFSLMSILSSLLVLLTIDNVSCGDNVSPHGQFRKTKCTSQDSQGGIIEIKINESIKLI